MSNWISVKDRMPPPMTLVLALIQYDTTPIIAERREVGGREEWWATCPEYGEVVGDGYWFGVFEGAGSMVTHWMPLPESPKP